MAKKGNSRSYELKEAKLVFSETIADMLVESGITRDTFSDEDIVAMVAECVDLAYEACWNEFVAWVEYGDDTRAKTLAAIRGITAGAAMYIRR